MELTLGKSLGVLIERSLTVTYLYRGRYTAHLADKVLVSFSGFGEPS